MLVRRCLVAAALALALIPPSVAGAQEIEDPVRLPFYGRTTFHGDSPWVAFIFYRPVSCIPRDFNLLVLSDIPRAFSCGPQLVDGHAVWETGIGIDPAGPMQVHLRGLGAVPIWFFRSDIFDAAQADGAITLAELEALQPLKGTAALYTEVLHPFRAVKNPLLIVQARGTLTDDRSFDLHITSKPGHRYFNVTFGN
jgi:hypothetical protein